MISPKAPDPALEAKSVQELQQLAHEAAARRYKSRSAQRGLSRAARLHLIDLLSRLGGSGLALVAGISIFLAVTAGQNYPARAVVWAVMVLSALYVCRRFRQEFRSGEHIASHPFRWRANYTAALSVLGAAFGAGAFVLLPAGIGQADALQALALILATAIGASALHAAHPKSAIAIGLPAGLFAIIGVARAQGFSIPFFASIGIGAAAVIGLIYTSRNIVAMAATRFPRTTFLRRELKPQSNAITGADAERSAAAI